MSKDPLQALGAAALVHTRRVDDHAPPHHHDEVMLFLPVQGRVRFLVEGVPEGIVCDEHQGVCVMAREEHAHEALDDEVEYLVVFLAEDALAEALDAANVVVPSCGAWRFTQTLLLRECAAQLAAAASTLEEDGAAMMIAQACLRLLAVGAAKGLSAPAGLMIDPWRPLPEDERLARAITLARERYVEGVSVDELAAAAAMSRRALERAFKAAWELSPRQYIEALRLHQAQSLLLATSKSVTEIAFEVGYRDLSHFIRVYSAAYGQSPTRARRALPQIDRALA